MILTSIFPLYQGTNSFHEPTPSLNTNLTTEPPSTPMASVSEEEKVPNTLGQVIDKDDVISEPSKEGPGRRIERGPGRNVEFIELTRNGVRFSDEYVETINTRKRKFVEERSRSRRERLEARLSPDRNVRRRLVTVRV